MNLAQKYTINSLDNIIGHDKIISELKTRIKDNNLPQTTLISGISGTGKSTLAKITKLLLCKCISANMVKIEPTATKIKDKASHSTTRRKIGLIAKSSITAANIISCPLDM